MSKTEDPNIPDLISTERRVFNAWVRFRQSHDLNDEKLKCCDITDELFDSLRAYETMFRGRIKQ